MKRVLYAPLFVLLFSSAAAGPAVPKAELFLGNNYVRVNSATEVPSFSSNGGSGQLAINFNKWKGAVADATASTALTPTPTGTGTTSSGRLGTSQTIGRSPGTGTAGQYGEIW